MSYNKWEASYEWYVWLWKEALSVYLKILSQVTPGKTVQKLKSLSLGSEQTDQFKLGTSQTYVLY
jgi:hypothetical protein